MIIIWGTRAFQKLLGNTITYTCGHCNNINPFLVVRVRRWFTLFWIPIFPISSKYFVLCPTCKEGTRVRKEEALAAVGQEPGHLAQ